MRICQHALGARRTRLKAQAAANAEVFTSRKALGTGWTSSTVHRTPWAASRASAAAPRADRGRRHTCWPQLDVRRVPQPSLHSGAQNVSPACVIQAGPCDPRPFCMQGVPQPEQVSKIIPAPT